MRLTRTPRVLSATFLLLASACTSTELPPVATSPVATTATPAGATQSPAQETLRPVTMSWSRIEDIPTPRSEVAAVHFEDKIWVIGGFGGLNVVERYDPLNRRWDRGPDLPIGLDHPMAAAFDGGDTPALFVIGGNSGGRPSDRVFRLRRGETAWTEVARMPRGRAAGAAVAFPGQAQGPEPLRVIVVGGFSDGGLERNTLVYDAVADTWTTRAPVPTPRDHLAATEEVTGICAIGGRTLSMSRNVGAFECYDYYADSWEQLPPMPTARGGIGVAAVAKKVVVVGGEQPQGTFKEVEIYDLATRTWSRGPDMPTPRHGIGVVGLGDQVFVMTGGPTPGGSQTAVCEVLTFETAR